MYLSNLICSYSVIGTYLTTAHTYHNGGIARAGAVACDTYNDTASFWVVNKNN